MRQTNNFTIYEIRICAENRVYPFFIADLVSKDENYVKFSAKLLQFQEKQDIIYHTIYINRYVIKEGEIYAA